MIALSDRTAATVRIIVDQLERCQDPWQRPWAGCDRLPFNALTGRAYSGMNALALWAAKASHGYTSEAWATLRQWAKKRARVRRGAKATLAYRPRMEGGKGGFALVHLFNADQVNGYFDEQPDFFSTAVSSPPIDTFVEGLQARVEHGGDVALYDPRLDIIRMPAISSFIATGSRDATESFYSVLLHECVHWSGHPSRLNRLAPCQRGEAEYALEELVAELGSAFLLASLGVAPVPREDHAIYLGMWIKALRARPDILFSCAGLAQGATRYLWSLAARGQCAAAIGLPESWSNGRLVS